MRRRSVGLMLLGMLVLVAVWWRVRSQPEADDDSLLNFVPPTADVRKAAHGALSQLAPELQRHFEPSDDFEPMRKPGPSDWLAKHHEGGQTFDDFRQAEPNRPDQQRRVIYLVAMGEFPESQSAQFEPLREFTEAYFTLETKLLPRMPLAEGQIQSRLNENTHKPQLLTTDLMRVLEQQLPDDAYCLLGITLSDLFTGSELNYVFGQATLRTRVGVFSFARFDPAFFDDPIPPDVETLMLRRSCRTLAHEISHMFGMHHCTFFTCVVNGSNNLAESDSRPLHACPVCLRKLHESVGFDPLKREEHLLGIYRQLHLDDEAAWVERRLSRLRTAP